MDAREIPAGLYIGPPGGEDMWSVQWRVIDGAWGLTDISARTIELDVRLRHDPSMLRDVWTHELMHACLHYLRLPRAFDKLEEKVVTALAPLLSRALAQGR